LIASSHCGRLDWLELVAKPSSLAAAVLHTCQRSEGTGGKAPATAEGPQWLFGGSCQEPWRPCERTASRLHPPPPPGRVAPVFVCNNDSRREATCHGGSATSSFADDSINGVPGGGPSCPNALPITRSGERPGLRGPDALHCGSSQSPADDCARFPGRERERRSTREHAAQALSWLGSGIFIEQ